MSDRVLIPLSDGRWLALSPEVFAQALRDGEQAMPSTRPSATESRPADARALLTSQQMEERTGVPASWWLKQARERRIPHQLFGKYPRFDLDALAREHLVTAVESDRRVLTPPKKGALRAVSQ